MRPCPAYDATLTATGVVSNDAKKLARGKREPPSWPTTIVVIPCETAANASRWAASPRS